MSMTVSPSKHELSELMELGHRLAAAAGAAILPHFRKPGRIDDKSGAGEDFDPVTAADVAAEQAMRELLEQLRPQDGVLGEEFPEKPTESGLTWVIDPVDGTRAFVMGLPLWGTLIALSDENGPILGIVDQPYIKDRFWGGPDGAYLNGDPISTSPCRTLEHARLSTTGTSWFSEPEKAGFAELQSRARLTRFGYDCYAYCMLAHGFIDLVVESGLAPYDVHALIPVVEGAGGVVTDWRGGRAHEGGQIIAAGDGALHEQALKFLGPFAA